MKSKVLWLIALSLFGLNIGSWWYYLTYRKNCQLVISALRKDQGASRSIEGMIKIDVDNSGIQLENIFVKDSSNIQVPLRSYFNKGRKYLFVIRFSEVNCESCIEHSIRMVKNKIDSFGKENVLFLGTYGKNRFFNQLKRSYGIDSLNVVNVNYLNIPAEELGYPYFFVIDSTLSLVNLFIPDKGSPLIDEKYLDFVETKFFSSN